MARRPRRPTAVPADARWVEEDKEWAQGALDDEGRQQGPYVFWRPDGTKVNECVFVDGRPHGPFKRFHENGEVSQDGEFVDGELHGTRRWFACDEPTTEQMHSSGVSESVRRSEMDYQRGRVVGVRHFDAEGRRVAPDGEPYPDRPASVPEGAEYHEGEALWRLGQADAETAEREGRWQLWTPDGASVEDSTWRQGERDGAATLYYPGGSPFRDERAVAETGVFAQGLPRGVWQLLDAEGRTVGLFDYGDVASLEGAPRLEPFADEGRAAEAWASLARARFEAGAMAEGLCLLARAAAASKSPTALREALEQRARPLREEAARALVDETDETLPALALALVRGAEPAQTLRKLAVVLDQALVSRAALDFIDAAILLEPAEHAFLFTRALILMSLGLDAQALRDAADVRASDEGMGRFLEVYTRALFPRFDFWPARVKPETHYDGLPDAPARTLEEVRAVAQKYATRLTALRGALLEVMTPEAPWMPPDVGALLPDGPVRLGAGSLPAPPGGDEDDEGVDFDETVDVDGDVPTLVRRARADWSALCWLCWACGLSEVALPGALEPPEDFGVAAGMAAQRLWRARDQRAFRGRNAVANDVPSFEWEGVEVATLSPPLAAIVEQQYAELQALFMWLTRDDAVTPWQDGLRGS